MELCIYVLKITLFNVYRTPYCALTKTLSCIEEVSARLKIIEILSNYFRSVIVLSPKDLLSSVYLCLNKVAPDYAGLELGIAETTLMKVFFLYYFYCKLI